MSRRLCGYAAAILLSACAFGSATASAQLPIPPILQPDPPGQDPDEPRPPAPEPDPDTPPPPTAPAAPIGGTPGTVTEGVDVAHTGFFADYGLVPPLVPRWRVKASGVKLLAADGLAFAVAEARTTAVSLADGRTVWSSDKGGRVATYDAGRLFLDGEQLTALDAATGALLWETKPAGLSAPSWPVAGGGVLYVNYTQSNIQLAAFDAATGKQLWSEGTVTGAGAPALDDKHVYVAGACARVSAHDRRSGAVVWHHDSGCSGGARVIPTLHGGRLYVPEQDHIDGKRAPAPIFDAATGAVVDRYDGAGRVFVDGLGVTSSAAIELATGAQAWEMKDRLGSLTAVGHDLYGLHNKELIAVDSETGAQIWSSGRLPSVDRGSEGGSTLTALAPAPGTLLVGRGGYVTAYESYFKPAPDGIAIGYDKSEVVTRRGFLVGVVGSNRREARPTLTVERAGWKRGGFRALTKVRPARDGGFAPRIPVTRNSRLRVTVGGARSNTITQYVVPEIQFGDARATRSGAVSLPVSVRSPGPSVAGRELVLYLDRRRTKSMTRISAATLRSSGRGGRTRASVVFRPLRKVTDKDRIYACVRGQLALELGKPSRFLRQCGARSIRE